MNIFEWFLSIHWFFKFIIIYGIGVTLTNILLIINNILIIINNKQKGKIK